MKFVAKNANNLISKDFNLAKSAACEVVEKTDLETFIEICNKSEFIFDFLKEKILKNLLDCVNEKNYRNLLGFTKCYCADFEDFIVLGLVKFANETLTDEICDFFENGTDEQKAYCAAYFTHILDPVALDLLKNNAFGDFEPLKFNCARALRAFDDREICNLMLERLENADKDEAMALEAVEFLAAYGDSTAFEPIYNFMRKTPYAPNVALNLLELKSFCDLVEEGNNECALQIFEKIINAYPEILPLETISNYGIGDFVEFLLGQKPQNVAKLILKTKIKFELINESESYTFDLDKAAKAEILEILNLLNSKGDEFYDICKNSLFEEFKNEKSVIDVFEVISELNLTQYCSEIAGIVSAANFTPLICEGVKTLKALNCLDLVDKGELIKKLSDPNAIALLGSYYE